MAYGIVRENFAQIRSATRQSIFLTGSLEKETPPIRKSGRSKACADRTHAESCGGLTRKGSSPRLFYGRERVETVLSEADRYEALKKIVSARQLIKSFLSRLGERFINER